MRNARIMEREKEPGKQVNDPAVAGLSHVASELLFPKARTSWCMS